MKVYQYWLVFLSIAFFQSPIQGQLSHRPIWDELDGSWKESKLQTTHCIDWSWPTNDTLQFRQFRLNGNDTIPLLTGKCNPFDKEVVLRVLDHSNQQTQQFTLVEEFNHALIWRSQTPNTALQTLEWRIITGGHATILQNGWASDYKLIDTRQRPRLMIGFQGGLHYRPARTSEYGATGYTNQSASTGYEQSFFIGLIGRQTPIGASIEIAKYKQSLDLKDVRTFDDISVSEGQYSQSGIRISFVPQVFLGKKQWLGIHAGTYFDIVNNGTFTGNNTLNGQPVPNPVVTIGDARAFYSRGLFVGFSMSTPWKYRIKPYISGRYFMNAYGLFIGVRA